MLALLVLSSSLAGCIDSSGELERPDSLPEDESWEVGDWWLYTFITPQFGEDSARLVVSEDNAADNQWMLGISNQEEAIRHAVVNHNPFLGRITKGTLSVYENGEEQNVLNFPWDAEDEWQFTLFGIAWSAEISGYRSNGVIVSASSSDGQSISYEYNSGHGFLDEFTWTDSSGAVQLEMQLVKSGENHDGTTWFYRGTDLIDRTYENTDTEVYDTFLDSGHPSGAEFNKLVWYLDVTITQGGSGSLTMKDHSGASPLTRAWGSNSQERGSVGTIPSNSGEYSLTIHTTRQGSSLHLKVAGAIENSWTL